MLFLASRLLATVGAVQPHDTCGDRSTSLLFYLKDLVTSSGALKTISALHVQSRKDVIIHVLSLLSGPDNMASKYSSDLIRLLA